MKTLIIDTSHKLLCVGFVVDGKILESFQQDSNKRQSEKLIKVIDEIFTQLKISPLDINQIVVTNGPGSYTGMRIGLTFVKTYALVNTDVEVYTVDTLLSISGDKDGFAFIDARSGRAFGAYTNNGVITDERVYQVEEISDIEAQLFGDLSLLGNTDNYGHVISNIMSVKNSWERVINPDVLVPNYLK